MLGVVAKHYLEGDIDGIWYLATMLWVECVLLLCALAFVQATFVRFGGVVSSRLETLDSDWRVTYKKLDERADSHKFRIFLIGSIAVMLLFPVMMMGNMNALSDVSTIGNIVFGFLVGIGVLVIGAGLSVDIGIGLIAHLGRIRVRDRLRAMTARLVRQVISFCFLWLGLASISQIALPGAWALSEEYSRLHEVRREVVDNSLIAFTGAEKANVELRKVIQQFAVSTVAAVQAKEEVDSFFNAIFEAIWSALGVLIVGVFLAYFWIPLVYVSVGRPWRYLGVVLVLGVIVEEGVHFAMHSIFGGGATNRALGVVLAMFCVDIVFRFAESKRSKPASRFQCGAVTRSGDPCRRWSSRDGGYCATHSLAMPVRSLLQAITRHVRRN